MAYLHSSEVTLIREEITSRHRWIGTNQTRTRRTERKTPGNGISKKLRASQRRCLRKELPKGAEAISSPHLPLGKSLKVNRWEAEPRDFNPFDPPLGGSYLQSSYKRIGSDTPDDTLYITETQEQMARTWKIPKPKLKFRPLVNFLTFTEPQWPGQDRRLPKTDPEDPSRNTPWTHPERITASSQALLASSLPTSPIGVSLPTRADAGRTDWCPATALSGYDLGGAPVASREVCAMFIMPCPAISVLEEQGDDGK
ncbi:hypothetical protein AAG570_001111 [Ranatra chinensis]|uniref:Uncharacterized protein n=1 Tax=Ranatra chinensis TaxID=642074 RepID=A0ABD0YAX7_9HEMI